LPEVVVLGCPFSVLVTVTVAPARTAPEASMMVPTMSPDMLDWAKAMGAVLAATNTARASRLNTIVKFCNRVILIDFLQKSLWGPEARFGKLLNPLSVFQRLNWGCGRYSQEAWHDLSM
jgi:hypothetical protein